MDYTELQHLTKPDAVVTLVRTTVTDLQPLRIKRGNACVLAASCLVKPELGDVVLCMVVDDDDVATILSVVERFEPANAVVLDMHSPLEIRVPSLSLMSEKVDVQADRVEVNVGVLKRLVDRCDDAIEFLSARVGTLFMHAKRSIKRVEELDETKAGHLRLESPTLVEVHGAATVVSGEELIKFQSKQIHMG